MMEDKIPLHTMLYRTHQVWNSANKEKAIVGLSTGQPKVLRYLVNHPRSLQKEIAKNCDIEAATASLLIDRMHKAGLIKIEKVKADKRARWISISEKGASAYDQWKIYTEGLEENMLKGLSNEERESFRHFLSVCYKNITGHDME